MSSQACLASHLSAIDLCYSRWLCAAHYTSMTHLVCYHTRVSSCRAHHLVLAVHLHNFCPGAAVCECEAWCRCLPGSSLAVRTHQQQLPQSRLSPTRMHLRRRLPPCPSAICSCAAALWSALPQVMSLGAGLAMPSKHWASAAVSLRCWNASACGTQPVGHLRRRLCGRQLAVLAGSSLNHEAGCPHCNSAATATKGASSYG